MWATSWTRPSGARRGGAPPASSRPWVGDAKSRTSSCFGKSRPRPGTRANRPSRPTGRATSRTAASIRPSRAEPGIGSRPWPCATESGASWSGARVEGRRRAVRDRLRCGDCRAVHGTRRSHQRVLRGAEPARPVFLAAPQHRGVSGSPPPDGKRRAGDEASCRTAAPRPGARRGVVRRRRSGRRVAHVRVHRERGPGPGGAERPGRGARGPVPERVVHNDAKLANVLFDRASGEALCVVDLDTVMPGLALYDFGDLVRSMATRAAEDERDLGRVRLEPELFESVACGYIAATRDLLTQAERDLLVPAAQVIVYEQAV